MKALLFLILLTLGSQAQLRIDPRGFKMAERELRTLFEPTISVFPKADDFTDPPLFISRNHEGPITLYERTPRGEVAIRLDSQDRYYCQFLYQFAHELAHVRANFQALDHENKWLEETLCETASLYVLRKLSSHWEKNAPNEALKNYRKNLTDYARQVMKTREPLTLKTSPAFYQKHRETLRKSATERTLNGAFANLILPLLEKNPEHWKILPHFPRLKGASLATHFEAWRKATPEKHHHFLARVEAIFLKNKTPDSPICQSPGSHSSNSRRKAEIVLFSAP